MDFPYRQFLGHRPSSPFLDSWPEADADQGDVADEFDGPVGPTTAEHDLGAAS